MKSIEAQLLSPECTRLLAEGIAQRFRDTPALILLSGDLGAGKTSFAQGFINNLEPCKHISSPTYSYLNIYKARLPIFHFDLYRISSGSQLEELGLWEHLLDEGALRLVEWPEHAPGLEQHADLHLILSFEGEHRQANLTYLKSFCPIG